jgi:hypothetical protein
MNWMSGGLLPRGRRWVTSDPERTRAAVLASTAIARSGGSAALEILIRRLACELCEIEGLEDPAGTARAWVDVALAVLDDGFGRQTSHGG